INGCGMCMDSHEKVVRDKGISRDGVQDAIRIASVVHAVAATFDAEEALAG
ncbi:MAG TPA: alkyl hydroperoxide reductase, partial [Tistrella mobilis]|nr:alkyl hydroperoxide reductase [Tistrella mobilis]